MKGIITTCLVVCFVSIACFLKAQTQVTFYTTKGTFVVTMEDVKRPITVGNFLGLVNAKFYDGIIFHRVINNFMIQGGDPTGTGSGGSGVIIADEFTPPVSNLQKVIAMANSGPNTGTSQFFINLVNNTYLNPNHPAFGTVTTNFSVVQTIGAVPTSGNPANKPLTDVVMDSLRVTFTTGIFDMGSIAENMEIFPNPVSNESVVLITSHSNQTAQITVYNQLGEIMYTGAKDLSEGINNIPFSEIQMNALSEGMYYLTVTEGNSVSQRKFIRVQ